MTPLRGLNEDYRDLLACLGRERVEFVLVGAYALAFHGSPRATATSTCWSGRRLTTRSACGEPWWLLVRHSPPLA